MAAQPLTPGSPTEPIELVPLRTDEPGLVRPKISLQQVSYNDSSYMHING